MANILVIDDNTTRWDFLTGHTLVKVPQSSTPAALSAAAAGCQAIILHQHFTTNEAYDWFVKMYEAGAPVLLVRGSGTGAPSGADSHARIGMASTGATSYGSRTTVDVAAVAHPVTDGLTGTVTVVPANTAYYSRATATAWAPGAQQLARFPGDTDPVVVAIERRAARSSGHTSLAPARAVWHGWASSATYTADGQKLLRQSVDWLLADTFPSGVRVLVATGSLTHPGYLQAKRAMEARGHTVIGCLDTAAAMTSAYATAGPFNLLAVINWRDVLDDDRDQWLAARWAAGVPLLLGGSPAEDRGSIGTSAQFPYRLGVGALLLTGAGYAYRSPRTVLTHPAVDSAYVSATTNSVYFLNAAADGPHVGHGPSAGGSTFYGSSLGQRGGVITYASTTWGWALEVGQALAPYHPTAAPYVPGPTAPARMVVIGWLGGWFPIGAGLPDDYYTTGGKDLIDSAINWLKIETTTVTPTAPTWVDDAVNGGGTWTTGQTGVVYTPESGTASPGQEVTVTATPAFGYTFPEGATTSWTHAFPSAPPTSCSWTHTFPAAPVDTQPPVWVPVLRDLVPKVVPYTPPHEHHAISIFEKGGQRRLFDITKFDLVRWERLLDQTGEATVRLTPSDSGCERFLADLRPMRHELVIYFNGKRSWEGPITLVQDHPDSFTLKARDVTYYLNRTVMRGRYNSRIAPANSEFVLDRILRILMAETERMEEPPLGINVTPFLSFFRSEHDARTSKMTEPGEKYVYEEIDDLAWRNGVDFGVAGRRIYFMDTDTPIGQTRRMTSDDFSTPVEVVLYGAELATEAYVTDRQGRFVSHGPGYSPYYGRVELLHGNYGESEDAAAAAAVTMDEMLGQAYRDFAPRYPLPMTVRVPQNATLKHNTFLELHDLMFPGVRIPLTAGGTVHQVSRLMKLKAIRVSEDSGGIVSDVTLTPASEAAAMLEDGG